ncbi:peptide chain release factor N(5)-glutamine methyltransferase [Alphaproteobacteria bacterium GH1-50]|uniref:Release factor glutamine methyltransferase n=1 Tax=Kangsaoukella pontilimi TaxID=2691042 RepID=A0A7C9IS22_9RHOB|nr:peptide chain release factor N(5)-glutamine methyltransferase [Kangsaoukella pontilimi]MXQ07545.1 peptide chain release factor N(5)-glutamine methyltransferase [Kangsaoukella pontilimi]
MARLSEVWLEGVARLEAAGIESARRDAQLLLAEAFGIPRDRISLSMHDEADPEGTARFWPLIDARAARRPVSRILGRRAFYAHEFMVTDATLDPRPETELLVELAIATRPRRVLDLGTGTGCILISILAALPEARGVGTDISPEAVLVAGENAAAIGVADRIVLPISDWFDDVGSRYDLIVSNPPYIAVSEMEGLSPEVRLHDPTDALTDGGDGLAAYRKITAAAPGHLTPGGALMVEIGPTQGRAVAALFSAAGLEDVEVHPDLDGRDRVVSGQKPA